MDDNQTFLMTTGFFTDEWTKPKEWRQAVSVLALCLWPADACLLFSTVDNDYFRKIIKCKNQDIFVPSRQSVTRKIHRLHDSYDITIKGHLKNIPGMFSVDTDSWSSRLYKNYFSLAFHWVHREWILRWVLLDFIQFPTPTNGSTTSSMLMELLMHQNLISMLRAVTTENASDIYIWPRKHCSIS